MMQHHHCHRHPLDALVTSWTLITRWVLRLDILMLTDSSSTANTFTGHFLGTDDWYCTGPSGSWALADDWLMLWPSWALDLRPILGHWSLSTLRLWRICCCSGHSCSWALADDYRRTMTRSCSQSKAQFLTHLSWMWTSWFECSRCKG